MPTASGLTLSSSLTLSDTHVSMKKLPVLLTIVMLVLALCAGAARPRKAAPGVPREDADKADYLFLEAMHARSLERHDAAYDLLERSYALNPDKETGLELSMYLVMLPTTDSLDRALGLMKDYWEANKADLQTGVRYATISDRMDRKAEAMRVWDILHALHPDNTALSAVYAQALGATADAANARRAIEVYDSIELAEGASIELSAEKIQVYYMQNDTAAIIAEADRLRQAAPGNADFAVFSGDIYSMFGHDDERALQLYDRACEIDPTNGRAYYSKARFFKSKNDSAAYDREVYNALRQEGLGVDTKLEILHGYVSQFYKDSIQQPRISQLFDTLVMLHPLEHDIHEMYAVYLASTGQYAEAAEQEEQTLGLDPADPDGWDMLMKLYMTTDRVPKALETLDRALRYYPENVDFLVSKGSLLGFEKRYAEGIEVLEKALELTDEADVYKLSSIYTAIGDCMQNSGRPDSAFVMYDKAILYNPDNLLALNNYAYFLSVADKDLDKALSMIEKVMASETDNPTSLDTYAWVLFKTGQYDKARQAIDSAMELMKPEELNDEIYEHAGDIYFMCREPKQAIEFWRLGLKSAPDNERLKHKVKNKTIYVEEDDHLHEDTTDSGN